MESMAVLRNPKKCAPGKILCCNISMAMKSPEIASVAVPERSRAALPATGESSIALQPLRRIQWAQGLILAVLYAVPAFFSLHIGDAHDPDVWWHLRTGEWILQHGAVPQTDPFSSFGAGQPWPAYSWLFELLIYQLFRWLGLVGLVAYTTTMAVCITVALHRLIQRLQTDFTIAALLTAVAAFSICRLYTPRPWLLSILFFALELDLLMEARSTGKIRRLLWLPVIFALWANLHIQFIDGLVVLVIAWAEAFLARKWTGIQTRLRLGRMSVVAAACVMATLANPYGWRIYRVAYELATQPDVLDKVTELAAMPFRSLDNWCVLLLALAAAGVLAKARRFALFEVGLLAFAIVVSFRSQRDVWMVMIAASAILASGLAGNSENRLRLKAIGAPLVAVATTLLVLLGFRVMPVDNPRLRARLAEDMPVRAVEVVKASGWNGPLYNDYNWGGYLIWALRMPVSMDGRTNLYGSPRLDQSFAVWNAQPGWAADPDLQKAGLVIGPVTAPLTQLLRLDPRFQLAYEDRLAAVFVARNLALSHPAPLSGEAARSGGTAVK
jgi:hypothetical protein